MDILRNNPFLPIVRYVLFSTGQALGICAGVLILLCLAGRHPDPLPRESLAGTKPLSNAFMVKKRSFARRASIEASGHDRQTYVPNAIGTATI